MRSGRGALAALALGLVVALAPAAPAGADAPTPTNYRSEVLEVDPAPPAEVSIEVVGGDSFLELRTEGTRVEVPDYGGETLYLRFEPDGSVWRNERAVATAANEDRFGSTDATPDPDAAPEWEQVADDGAFAWHDHRIHWMSPSTPQAVDDDGRVDLGGPDGRWEVPLTIDGTDTTVVGQLWLEPAPPLWPSIVATTALAGALVAVGLRRRSVLTVAGLVAAGGAVGASFATAAALPVGIAGSWVPFAVSGLAVVAAVTALATRPPAQLVALVALASTLIGWGVGRLAVLTSAVVPTAWPPGLDRAVTVAAIAAGVAIGALAVSRPPVSTEHASPRSAVSQRPQDPG